MPWSAAALTANIDIFPKPVDTAAGLPIVSVKPPASIRPIPVNARSVDVRAQIPSILSVWYHPFSIVAKASIRVESQDVAPGAASPLPILVLDHPDSAPR